jgi:hypothetical protein
MEKLEIRILPQAAMKLSRQAEWYLNKCGKSISITLIKNTVLTLKPSHQCQLLDAISLLVEKGNIAYLSHTKNA